MTTSLAPFAWIARWRGYAATVRLAAASAGSDGLVLLVENLLRVGRVGVLLAVWRVVFADRAEIDGYTLPALLTYTLLAEIFTDLLTPRLGIDVAIWNGTIVATAMRPGGLMPNLVAEMIGRTWVWGLALAGLPLLLLAPWLGVPLWPPTWAAALAAVVSLGLAVALGLVLDYLFACLILILEVSPWIVTGLKGALVGIVSGLVVPLALFPWSLGSVLGWLPFAGMAAPLRIYVGHGSPVELLALQLAWVVILWPVALVLWHRYRERLAIHGG